MSDYTDIVHGMLGNNQIFVDGDNGDDNWKGTRMQPVKTITAAMALVSSTRKHVIVLPCTAGEYDEADAVSWPTTSGVCLEVVPGNTWKTVIKSSDSTTNVINMAPGAQSSTWEAYLIGVYLEVGDGYDGIGVVHTDVGKKMNLYLTDFASDCASDDEVIKVTHGGSGNAVRLYFQGGENGDIEGIVYHQFTDNGDRIHAVRCNFAGGFNTGTTDITGELKLKYCGLKHAGVTGGHANHVYEAIFCYSDNSGTLAAIDDNEITEAVSWDTNFGGT